MSSPNFMGPSVVKLLEDSERMLAYAARAGKPIQLEISETIAMAREAQMRGDWAASLQAKLYCAQSDLANAIKPVTAEALDPKVMKAARKAARRYFSLALLLTLIIVPASMVMFVDSKLSESGKALIDKNDKIAIPLHEALERQRISITSTKSRCDAFESLQKTPLTPVSAKQGMSRVSGEIPGIDADLALTPSVLVIKEQLQEFARNNRQLYAETIWLERLSLHGSENPYESPWMANASTRRENLEVTLPMLLPKNWWSNADTDDPKPKGPEHAIDDGMEKLAVYQDIRAMAQNAEHTSDFFWSAIIAYLLPVLYAVLGTFAFILRDLCARTRSYTYHASHARCSNHARVIVAAIVGTVIGLFDKFMDSSISASPLALAFIAGYAVDPFFALIDHIANTGREPSVAYGPADKPE
ncbi:hypothetical protein [Paraburkholderia nodosa]|uniref:hypothetical protein n=1 Tax=Paraburkholderia nodosa TaxID=392320 RepID=UPI000AF340ED|nr:hypothetical protein [Paraburkholderia nodosa]